jgi:LAO/AO transport system kinase
MKKERTEDVAPSTGGWTIPVLRTVAQSGEGVGELFDAVAAHRTWLVESGELENRRRERARTRIRDVVDRELRRIAWSTASSAEQVERGLDDIADGEATPYSVARAIVDDLLAREAVDR